MFVADDLNKKLILGYVLAKIEDENVEVVYACVRPHHIAGAM